MTIYEILRENAVKHPKKTVYYYFKTRGTYGELLEKADVFAKHLAEAGVREGSSVSICLPNCPAVLVALFAANKLGARAVMLSPKSPAGELKRQMEMTDTVCLIFSDVCGENVAKALASSSRLSDIPRFYSEIFRGLPIFFRFACCKKLRQILAARRLKGSVCMDKLKDIGRKVEAAHNDDEEAAVVFSGGTSGEYKAIVHSSRALYCSAKACEKLASPHPEDIRMLSVLPAFHMFGLEVAIVLPVCIGGACVLVPFFHIKTIAKLMAKDCPEFMAGVPTIFKRIYECGILQNYEKRRKLNVNRFIWGFCGGDYLAKETQCAFNALIVRNGGSGYLSMGYGMSECCPISVAEKNWNEEKCVGKLLSGCTVKICDEQGNQLSDGALGEIYLYSDFLMKKYFFEDGRTFYPLIDEAGMPYIKTGDMGYMKEGRLYYEHRIRRIIKVSGHTVFAGYVEQVIKKHPEVSDAIVVPVKHETRGYSTYAFVIGRGALDQERVSKEIIRLCRQELIPYAIPAGISFCEESDIKMTILGKVVYGELEMRAGDLMRRTTV